MKKRDLKAALIVLSAQFIHTGLGVRSIDAYVRRETDFKTETLEYTINHHEHDVLKSLYHARADIYLFSCYIWNIEIVLRLASDLRQLCPDVLIGLGGPQVSYQTEALLRAHPNIDIILTGEGEETVCQLLRLLSSGAPLRDCAGLVYRDGEVVTRTAAPPPLSLDQLAFAYPDLDELAHRIVYYESMRGCPFACSYCTSSIERGVRKRSLSLVFADLAIFLEHRVPQVKFVDRTFNCDRAHSRGIWEWLAAHDNGVTNFHFELSGELLDEDTLAFLSGIRPGLFQFEVGVQSTHPETLAEIDRPSDLTRLFANVRRLLAGGNIHVHLDLIAGLPYEDMERFQMSFNDVYACAPHQFQLGFLKVLPGSKMAKMAQSYDLVHSQSAPYEVLSTRWLSYSQLCTLQGVADMVQRYYNSFRFSHIIARLAAFFPSPFAFYHALWEHFDRAAEGKPVSQIGYFELLHSFALESEIEVTEEMQWLAKYDLLLHEKPRKLPSWIDVNLSRAHHDFIRAFWTSPENIAAYLPEYQNETSLRAERTAHLEVFPFHPESGEKGLCAIVFNYRQRQVTGMARVRVLAI